MTKETKKKISNGIRKFRNNKFQIKEKITKCKYCGKEIKYFYAKNKPRYCSKECKHNYLSEHIGGYRENSIKRFKSGNYKGIHCDSSWELAFLVYYLDHNLFIKRCDEIREYFYNGKKHKLYSRFYYK